MQNKLIFLRKIVIGDTQTEQTYSVNRPRRLIVIQAAPIGSWPSG